MHTVRHRRFVPVLELLAATAMLVCLAPTAAFAGPSSEDEARILRGEAVAALHAGERTKAATYLTAAAKLAPDPGLWTLVGDMNASLDRLEQARSAWRAGLDLAPADSALLERTARLSAHIGDWAAAADAQRRLVDVLAVASSETPDATRTDMLAGRTLTVTHSHRIQLGRLATLAVLAGDFTRGEKAARALIEIDPTSIEGHLALGYVFLQARELDEAAEAYAEALAIDPDNPMALNNLGTIYYMDRDLKGAGMQFEAVLGSRARGPYAESIALSNLGELHQLEARYDDATYLYDQAIEAFPRGAWSYMGRAAVLDLMGAYDAALDTMIDGWERDANGLTRLNMHFFQPEWAWQRDALIAEIEGQWKQASALWQKVLQGDVPALHRSAAHHLHSIELMLDR